MSDVGGVDLPPIVGGRRPWTGSSQNRRGHLLSLVVSATMNVLAGLGVCCGRAVAADTHLDIY